MAKKTNFTVNGYEYYKVTKTIGHKADGTPIKKPFYGSCKSEAEEKAEQYLQNLKLGLQTDKGLITIGVLLPKWLFQHKKTELKPSTIESYEGLFRNYIEPDIISNRPINELKSTNIEQFYDRLKKKKAVHSDKNVTTKRIIAIHKLLHSFFVYVEKEGFTLKNPCENANVPKEDVDPEEVIQRKLDFDFFTEDEIKILLPAFNGSLYQDIVAFALATGMRQGEILGLQWTDLDFENRLIHVMHNLVNVAVFDENRKRTYKLLLTTPKSKHSIRTIPMNDTVYNMLVNKERKNTMVFPSRNNTYICNKNVLKVWQRRIESAGLRYRTFHDLRHTFATLMLAKGCDLVTLKELMGHSSIKITEIYLQAIPEIKHEVIKNMDFIKY